jgi:hypothetical protein
LFQTDSYAILDLVKWQNANIDASMGKEIDIPGLFIENPTEEDLRFSEILVKEIPENVPAIPYPLGINLKDAGNCLIDRLRLSDLLHASFRLLPDPLIPGAKGLEMVKPHEENANLRVRMANRLAKDNAGFTASQLRTTHSPPNWRRRSFVLTRNS